MARSVKNYEEIRDFILRNVNDHPATIVARAMGEFKRTRPTILSLVERLVADGFLTYQGQTRARRYQLKPIVEKLFTLEIDHLWSEDTVWRNDIRPLTAGLPQNVIDLCHYGFTEMLNNAIDHACSPSVRIHYRQDYAFITITIMDRGIGIFKKIQQDFRLSDPRTALLELSKGRLTSDRRNHAGEGIYFTSRMFDRFRIRSGHLFYSRMRRDGDDWLIEVNDRTALRKGTYINMHLRTNADWTTQSVFEKYQGDNMRFRKTHVPIKLAQYPGEQLVSRSQAKRLLARFDNFSEVFLDFTDVEHIGQPFADEIFRVFRTEHPEVSMQIANANQDIRDMIKFVSGDGREEDQPDLFVESKTKAD